MARRYLDQATAGETSPRLLNLSAYVAFHATNLPDALHYAERASEVFAGDLPRLGRILALLAQIHHRLGNRQAAIDHMLSALSVMEQSHDVLGHARARSNLGAIYMGEGNLRSAWKYYRDLPAELARLGDVESLEATKKNLDLLNEATRRWNRRSA
jgi:tetratricopeptide (TPR) repeat protein